MSETFPIPTTLVTRLRDARNVVVLTGAGVSAESSIPTFRDAMTGIWARFRAEELATPEAFLANPGRVWDWYQWRKSLVQKARPNPGHFALAAMEAKIPNFKLVTQNVDGLHEQAGSREPLELHGNLLKTKCFEQNHPVSDWEEDGQVPPRCPQCGGNLRPDVVWFGESLPQKVLGRAMEASANADLFFFGGNLRPGTAGSLPHLRRQQQRRRHG